MGPMKRGCQLPIALAAGLWLWFFPLLVYGSNSLLGHPSPYLAMHGEDPVEWRDWSARVLEEARQSGRPIFISSGYFSCHWCHVMHRESYNDPDIAHLLNTRFIPVKLDRELNPALDDHLIRFVELTRGQAGWPLNVFLTPDGYPLAGLTYLPATDFRQVLERVAEKWKTQSELLTTLARSAAEQLRGVGVSGDLADSLPVMDDFVAAILAEGFEFADELAGGFGSQNKFPMEPQLATLLALQERRADARLEAFLRLTLDEMRSRGLRDHLSGGFFRYTVDPDWRTPHFEKMLYNQAQLARLYLVAARVMERPSYRDVATDTLDFVLTEMRADEGGYIAALSAVDATGDEGGAYLWRTADLEELLTPRELAIARAYWSLDPSSSPATGLLPQRLRSAAEAARDAGVSEMELQTGLPAIRGKLLAQRAGRLPPRDTKALAGWNGLLLTALVEAAESAGHERYRQAAEELAGFLRSLWDGERLYRARQGPRILGEPSLEDYAYVGEGLARWALWSGDEASLAVARAIVAKGWRQYFDASGWRLSADSLLPGMAREPAMKDGALPAPSAVLLNITPLLWPTDNRPDDYERARAMSTRPVRGDPFWYASHAINLLSG